MNESHWQQKENKYFFYLIRLRFTVDSKLQLYHEMSLRYCKKSVLSANDVKLT